MYFNVSDKPDEDDVWWRTSNLYIRFSSLSPPVPGRYPPLHPGVLPRVDARSAGEGGEDGQRVGDTQSQQKK